MFWNRLKISARLLMIVFGTVVGFVAIGGFSLYEIRANLLEDRLVKTRNLVEAAHSLVSHYAKLADSGATSVEEAQELAKQAVKVLRYDDKEYFWINDMHPPHRHAPDQV